MQVKRVCSLCFWSKGRDLRRQSQQRHYISLLVQGASVLERFELPLEIFFSDLSLMIRVQKYRKTKHCSFPRRAPERNWCKFVGPFSSRSSRLPCEGTILFGGNAHALDQALRNLAQLSSTQLMSSRVSDICAWEDYVCFLLSRLQRACFCNILAWHVDSPCHERVQLCHSRAFPKTAAVVEVQSSCVSV